jgi:hypothetical protein
MTIKALGLILLAAIALGGLAACRPPSYYVARHRAGVVVRVEGQGGKIDQATLDRAWKRALEIGGGNPEWALPVPLARVVYVPSSLVIGPYQFYGITVTEPAFVDGKLVLVETIEIHLPDNMACHIEQVLTHELLHTVATRRMLTDSEFQKVVERYQNEEAWVRAVWPVEDMGLCAV